MIPCRKMNILYVNYSMYCNKTIIYIACNKTHIVSKSLHMYHVKPIIYCQQNIMYVASQTRNILHYKEEGKHLESIQPDTTHYLGHH